MDINIQLAIVAKDNDGKQHVALKGDKVKLSVTWGYEFGEIISINQDELRIKESNGNMLSIPLTVIKEMELN